MDFEEKYWFDSLCESTVVKGCWKAKSKVFSYLLTSTEDGNQPSQMNNCLEALLSFARISLVKLNEDIALKMSLKLQLKKKSYFFMALEQSDDQKQPQWLKCFIFF